MPGIVNDQGIWVYVSVTEALALVTEAVNRVEALRAQADRYGPLSPEDQRRLDAASAYAVDLFQQAEAEQDEIERQG